MKLHRLVLKNYRGIAHREIEFPDRGVVVVCGANEVGKSSMIEALDLLLESRDRSTKKEVKQVKPTHADVGSEVTAEISTGTYRFVYHKRFHKRCETQLTVLAPHREQLSGDEAHERVRAMLGETVDMNLWRAQRVLQAGSIDAVDLSGCDALSRALDLAAGEPVDLSGTEPSPASGKCPLLVDRIEAEYLRYFSATGRPTGEWAAATMRLHDADQEVARCVAATAEVDDAVRRHGALTADLAGLSVERGQASQTLATARAAADAVAALAQQLDQAQLIAGAARATHAASVAALAERHRLRADMGERGSAGSATEAAAAQAVEEEATAREVAAAADAAAQGAQSVVQANQTAVDAARRTVERLTDRDEADRLSARLAKIDAAHGDLERIDRDLTGIALTDRSMRNIETAALAVDRAAGQLELASARIELVAAADVELRVEDETVSLHAGTTWSVSTAAPTAIELPGLLTARVVPGAPAAEIQAKLRAVQHDLAAALDAAGAPDVVAARLLDDRRRDLRSRRERLSATWEALTGEDPIEELRARLAELQSDDSADAGRPEPAEGLIDLTAARAQLQAAVAAHRNSVSEAETHRKVAAAAATRLAEAVTRAVALRAKQTAAHAELTLLRERLAAARAAITDDELAVRAEADADAARHADERVTALRAELDSRSPEAVAAVLDHTMRQEAAVSARHDAVAEELREVTTQLRVYGTEGRRSRLDAAESERAHAETEYRRVYRRARAAQLLRSVMVRHRDATRSRYVDPFRTEVERLGRIVFGDTFEVDIDSDLKICSRTLSGRTVTYDSLSGGAREQLGIVARLAAAAMVAQQDSVPVIIDDALGYTDAERLTRMGAVFDAVGGDGQVIVLTCSPHRYTGIGDAHHIELTA